MKFVTETLYKYSSKYGWIYDSNLADGGLDLILRLEADEYSDSGSDGTEYNLELIGSLMLDQRKAVRYLTGTRIELDHVIDIVGPDTFFAYLKETMEDRFEDRDYNFAIDKISVDEIIPIEVRELIARFRKFITQLPKVQSKYSSLLNGLKDIKGIQEVDKEHHRMLDELTGVITKDSKCKRLISNLRKVTHDFQLPELSDEEKRRLA
jgi:hypothetical protein